jgi:hypothetical protein
MRGDQGQIANTIVRSNVISPMKCQCVALVSDLPGFLVKELIFTNVVLCLLVYLCLEKIVLIFSVGFGLPKK